MTVYSELLDIVRERARDFAAWETEIAEERPNVVKIETLFLDAADE